jgi:hypothetical protein
MLRRSLALALLAVTLPQLALARQAVVGVFEAPARSEPSLDAPVLELLVERTAISVSEELQDGWRRVRLQDGRSGWIEERALTFPAADALGAARAPAPVAAAPAPDLRPRIYVKDLSHLAELVKEDPTVSFRAKGLARRRSTAIGIWVAGGIAAVALAGASASGNADPGDPRFDAQLDASRNMLLGGVAVSIVSGLLGIAIHPKRGDVLDVVNDWNRGHQDRPFELERGEVGLR